ncbi:hypothetical protein GCM10009862_09400 [Microbacterium binotii]|uniref:Uncharacterized protein n=1 Tax=Microbacterium binotii TaxID=462710 RepID=A0ABN3P8T1_9MICO
MPKHAQMQSRLGCGRPVALDDLAVERDDRHLFRGELAEHGTGRRHSGELADAHADVAGRADEKACFGQGSGGVCHRDARGGDI